jgi:hypothetical protein
MAWIVSPGAEAKVFSSFSSEKKTFLHTLINGQRH